MDAATETPKATKPDQADPLVVFLTSYVASLKERTRGEKHGITYGFDWVIYNLALALDLTPVRLPFFRLPEGPAGRTKTEPEFGVDMAFLNAAKDELRIMVLKDEELSNRNWTGHDFDRDLRMAACPDLGAPEFATVARVVVTLCYNKDEDHAGLTLFANLTSQLGTKVGDNRSLAFERWNLSKISELLQLHLVSPDLLPQHLAGLFRYICSQVADFAFGSEEWDKQLVPNWKRFLREAVKAPFDERALRLLPVTLVILDRYRRQTPDSIPGWLDLAEWAMLRLWDIYPHLDDQMKPVVLEAWVDLYLARLEQYLVSVAPALSTVHGLRTMQAGFLLDALNDAYVAHWHTARIGLHVCSTLELLDMQQGDLRKMGEMVVSRAASWIAHCIAANPACLRPLIDLDHIPLYLMWRVLWQAGAQDEIYGMLGNLESRLLVRRLRKADIPFVDGGNRLSSVAEAVATGDQIPELIVSTSYLLLMLLEVCFVLDNTRRNELLARFYNRVVHAIGDDGQPFNDFKPITLLSLIPPDDWARRVVVESVRNGIAVTSTGIHDLPTTGQTVAEMLLRDVQATRKAYPTKMQSTVPESVLILGCIKNGSPLPPEFWRGITFPPSADGETMEAPRDADAPSPGMQAE